MEQYTDSQYDDDLTVGIDDNAADSFDAGFVDLFERSGDDESPIARLKTIVLSIDWEINDEVLTQFNDELLELKNVWADDQISLVYVQALEKISKYIYQFKSDSHPNAIKLLLNFYHNLEKVVLGTDLSEAAKKEILRGDVKKFEQLKQQIAKTSQGISRKDTSKPEVSAPATGTEQGEPHPTLFNLKACILGMDWEITERELSELGTEVKRLENEFAGDRAKMIFLQGIGALGGYIKLKKSDAHADAFKLLYSFYEGLEKIVVVDLPREEKKAILLEEVEKFEEFKAIIAPTISPEALAEKTSDGALGDYSNETDDSIAPAFADVPDEVHGFQADKEAADLESSGTNDVDSRLNNFFGEDEKSEPEADSSTKEVLPKEALEKIDSFFGEEVSETSAEIVATVNADEALRGVDVETEADDDSGEEALPTEDDGKLAPALSDSGDEEYGFNPDLNIGRIDSESNADIDDHIGNLFDQNESSEEVDRVAALQGVDVETEADDESGEESLPIIDDEIAPALAMEADVEEETEPLQESSELPTDIEERLDSFFDGPEVEEEVEPFTAAAEEPVADETEEELDSFFDGPEAEEEVEPVAAAAEEPVADETEEELDFFFDEPEAEEEVEPVAAAAEEPVADEIEEELTSFLDEPEAEEVDPAAPAAEEPVADDPEAKEFEITGTPEDETLTGEVEDVAFAEDNLDYEETSFSDDSAEQSEKYAPSFTLIQEDTGDVIFEAVDSEETVFDDEIPLAKIEEENSTEDRSLVEESSSFGSDSDEEEFFAAIDERVDEPGEFQMELLDEADELEPDHVQFAEDDVEAAFQDEALEEVAPSDSDEFHLFAPDDNLADLRAGIASIEVEINESIIAGILSEINSLRHRMMTRPVEKTLLQLLSTIVQHIAQYGYESSSEAYGLMLSVFDKLELTQNSNTTTDQAQEALLAETCKILLWQKTMLDRQAVKKGDQLTFTTSVRSDLSEKISDDSISQIEAEETTDTEIPADQDFSAVFEIVEDGKEEFEGKELSGDVQEDTLEVTDVVEKMNKPEHSSDSLAALVKNEIKVLREALELEIRELRDKIREKE